MRRSYDHLFEAPQGARLSCAAVLQGMKYIDLHCDALTKCEGVFQVTKKFLEEGGCLLQCFAAFIKGKDRRFERALSLCDAFDAMCEKEKYLPVRSASDLQGKGIHAMLTVEEGGAVEGSLEKLERLHFRGVRMMTLTWNYPNELGLPHTLPSDMGGLSSFGKACVERMCELKMLPDVSHGNDSLLFDTAAICRAKGFPLVASHSNARAVHFHTRNLSDEGIRTIANCGGAVGLNFYQSFLSADGSEAGQRNAILTHAKHILRVGGEDVLALGSDFDGAPPNPYLPNAAHVPKLLFDLEKAFGARIAEKIAYQNALRVFASLG